MVAKVRGTAAGLLVAALLAPVGLAVESGEASGEGPVFEAGLAERIALDPDAVLDALVSVAGSASMDDVRAVEQLGLRVVRLYEDFGVLYVVGVGEDLLGLASLERVTHVAENRLLELAGGTFNVATRARDVWDDKSTSRHPVTLRGQVIDGAGVGVAVVGPGVDGTHPDLAPAMAGNKRFVCPTEASLVDNSTMRTCTANALLEAATGVPLTGCTSLTWVDLEDTDFDVIIPQHDTWVAGILAGRGVASDGRYVGAAPGARLFGFGTTTEHASPVDAAEFAGEEHPALAPRVDTWYAVEAFYWIHCNHATADPPIRVVNNSWADFFGVRFEPQWPINRAVTQLVADGIVVVFGAANQGGDGSQDTVGMWGKNPTPGVVNVAGSSDRANGGRSEMWDGMPEPSSRGWKDDPVKSNWPDLAAPAACVPGPSGTLGPTNAGLTLTGQLTSDALTPTHWCHSAVANEFPYYVTGFGTSASAPQVAGIAAMLLQVNPALTPAEVEDILEDTAVQFDTPGGYVPDPSNPTNGINYASGHGLVDALAALQDPRVLGARARGSAQPQVSQSPHVLIAGQAVQPTPGAPPDVALRWGVPTGVEVTLSERFLTSGNAAAYPLSVGQPARFRVSGPEGVRYLCTSVEDEPPAALPDAGLDPIGFRVDAPWSFAVEGAYFVEPQLDFGRGFVAFDRFGVRATGVGVSEARTGDRVTPMQFGACQGGSSALTETWDFGDGAMSTAANPSHTYARLGTFQPTLTTSDGEGGVTVDSFAPVTVLNLKPVAAGLPSSLVANRVDAVSFEDASTDRDGSIAQRDWDFGDGGASGDAGASHTYARLGTFGTSLTVMDNDGDSASMAGSVEVVNLLPSVGFAHSPQEPIILEPVLFDGTASDRDGSVAGWHWDFGDGETSQEEDPVHVYAHRGQYPVTLTVTDNDGGVSHSVRTVHVCAPVDVDALVTTGHVRLEAGGCVKLSALPLPL
jgi:serine protease AprX